MVKLEITIDVIIHATEDIVKFFRSFNEMFELEEGIFSSSEITGHFENPITVLRAKITKKPANQFLEKFVGLLSEHQKNEIIDQIEERTENSSLHIRFDKQKFVQGQITFMEKEAIKLKIHTPVYNKKDTIKVFSKFFR
ncbi:MAG: exosome protein [Nitrosopumilus sp.]|nr:exosome protein [Nitrosopumilus sp.]MDH3385324.1 exosome protein [Nitrosopumilus sp.]